MARYYLDHASTSPLRPSARAAMAAVLADTGGNWAWADPGRIHTEGMVARALLEEARTRIAEHFGARSRSVVLTSGATEAIASACFGAAGRPGHQVLSAVEHSAVRRSASLFSREVTIVGCDRTGRVDPESLAAAVRADTTMVHLQLANHEVGTIQPVAELLGLLAEPRSRGLLVHVDAAAAAGTLPIDFDGWGIDLMSVSAHKMGGPPGIGALLVRRGLRIEPLLTGGDQERARRAGLENVLGAVGWAGALEGLRPELEAERARLESLSSQIRQVAASIDGVELYGPVDSSDRLAHLSCLGIAGVEPQGVLIGLDQHGIAAHSGSACASEDLLPSPVLEAMGVDAHRSLRLSVGWDTSAAGVAAVAEHLPAVVARLRALAGPGR